MLGWAALDGVLGLGTVVLVAGLPDPDDCDLGVKSPGVLGRVGPGLEPSFRGRASNEEGERSVSRNEVVP